MKTIGSIRWALLASALLASPTLALGDGIQPGDAPGCAVPAPATKLCLRAEVIPHKETEQVPVVPPPYVARSRQVEREQPVTRTVSVCVTDPATGCTHTEYKPETRVEKVKVTVIEVCPNDAPCTVKTEERTRSCVNVYIECRPACPTPAAP